VASAIGNKNFLVRPGSAGAAAGQDDLSPLLFEPGVEHAGDGAAEAGGVVGGEQAGHRLARQAGSRIWIRVAVAREGVRRLLQGLPLEGQLALPPGQFAGDRLGRDRLRTLGGDRPLTGTGPAAYWP
jgi:hypothetical protein